jgi:hypothetical protein
MSIVHTVTDEYFSSFPHVSVGPVHNIPTRNHSSALEPSKRRLPGRNKIEEPYLGVEEISAADFTEKETK